MAGKRTSRRFSDADFNAASDFYTLGRAKLEQFAALTSRQLAQSVELALLSLQTGVSIGAIKAGRVKLCGPRGVGRS